MLLLLLGARWRSLLFGSHVDQAHRRLCLSRSTSASLALEEEGIVWPPGGEVAHPSPRPQEKSGIPILLIAGHPEAPRGLVALGIVIAGCQQRGVHMRGRGTENLCHPLERENPSFPFPFAELGHRCVCERACVPHKGLEGCVAEVVVQLWVGLVGRGPACGCRASSPRCFGLRRWPLRRRAWRGPARA